jgi:hypothetical protein
MVTRASRSSGENEHPVSVHLQLGTMPFDERRERGGIAARRRGDQPLVEPE